MCALLVLNISEGLADPPTQAPAGPLSKEEESELELLLELESASYDPPRPWSCPDLRYMQRPPREFELGAVPFDSGQGKILISHFAALDQIARTLRIFSDVKRVRIEGYTDRYEPNAIDLSLKRATGVMAYLIKHGVEPWRLTVVAFGTRCPRSRGLSMEDREKNRRVEVRVLQTDTELPPPPRCRDPKSEQGLRFKPPAGTVEPKP